MNPKIEEICNILLKGTNESENMRQQVYQIRFILNEEIESIEQGDER